MLNNFDNLHIFVQPYIYLQDHILIYCFYIWFFFQWNINQLIYIWKILFLFLLESTGKRKYKAATNTHFSFYYKYMYISLILSLSIYNK